MTMQYAVVLTATGQIQKTGEASTVESALLQAGEGETVLCIEGFISGGYINDTVFKVADVTTNPTLVPVNPGYAGFIPDVILSILEA